MEGEGWYRGFSTMTPSARRTTRYTVFLWDLDSMVMVILSRDLSSMLVLDCVWAGTLVDGTASEGLVWEVAQTFIVGLLVCLGSTSN